MENKSLIVDDNAAKRPAAARFFQKPTTGHLGQGRLYNYSKPPIKHPGMLGSEEG
jgi:hypothetical protein